LDEIWKNVSQMLGANLGKFWARSAQQRQIEREPNFCFFFVTRITQNFADFPTEKFLRHFNTTTSIGAVVKTFGTEF